jgi:hypothetical protein
MLRLRFGLAPFLSLAGWVAPFVVAAVALSLAGCTPSIGDKCILNTDCSLSGDRQCDTSEPGGYCTIFNCTPNSCPDNAACILFNPAVAGCPYDDRNVSRTAHSFCMAACRSDGDCRSGYTCANVTQAPWNAINQDANQLKTVCVPAKDDALKASGVPLSDRGDPPVCQAAPELDASFTPVDAGPERDAGDAGDASDAESDAGADADAGAVDAGADVDAGVADATID